MTAARQETDCPEIRSGSFIVRYVEPHLIELRGPVQPWADVQHRPSRQTFAVGVQADRHGRPVVLYLRQLARERRFEIPVVGLVMGWMDAILIGEPGATWLETVGPSCQDPAAWNAVVPMAGRCRDWFALYGTMIAACQRLNLRPESRALVEAMVQGLGAMLVARGVVTPAECEQAEAPLRRPGGQDGG